MCKIRRNPEPVYAALHNYICLNTVANGQTWSFQATRQTFRRLRLVALSRAGDKAAGLDSES